jgi:hypothetical protein
MECTCTKLAYTPAPVSSPHPRPPSSTHSRIPRHPRSYDNDFTGTTHDGFEFGMYYEDALIDGENTDEAGGSNIDSDGETRAVNQAKGAGTILEEFGRGETQGRRLDSNSNTDNV